MSLKKWNFVQDPDKPQLDALSVNYWKNSLDKVLKVGAELEFNLPSTKGNCKGDNMGCGCAYLLTHDCWTNCLNKSFCESNRSINTCKNKVDTCSEEDCEKCTLYEFNCPGLSCSHFISKCHMCDEFTVDCHNCKFKHDPSRDPKSIRQFFKGQFTPNNCYGIINKSGVHSIKQDGSLLGDRGAEIITIGRRVNYWEFYNMFKNIIDAALEKGAYMDERCSVHMHVLASYYDRTAEGSNEDRAIPNYISELEKPLPEIVMLNLHQLIRKYQNALTWMGMALDTKENLTRWEKFRISVLDISPLKQMKSMQQIQREVFDRSEGRKYGFVNYQFLKFVKDSGDLRTFHIEFRHLDGIASPSALAAFACLWHAMVIKAVEISRYGILEMESKSWLEKAKRIKEAMMNNIGDWGSPRFSNTTQIEKYEDELRQEAFDLVHQVKHTLLDKGPAYDILENIAAEPIAYKRCRGEQWEEIEAQLKIREPEELDDPFTRFVDEVVDLRIVSGTDNFNLWINNVATIVREEGISDKNIEDIKTEVELYVNDKQNVGDFIWSDSLGTMVAV